MYRVLADYDEEKAVDNREVFDKTHAVQDKTEDALKRGLEKTREIEGVRALDIVLRG
jgi:hypothetical protein